MKNPHSPRVMWVGISINPGNMNFGDVVIDRETVSTYLARNSGKGQPTVAVSPKGTTVRAYPPDSDGNRLVCILSGQTDRVIGFGRLVGSTDEGRRKLGTMARWFRESGLTFKSRMGLWVLEGVSV
jgi:hypothetical protein